MLQIFIILITAFVLYPCQFTRLNGTDHVRSVSNMEGITRLQKIRDGVLTEDIHETLAFIGDTGRVIAWLWLMHKGYVETYA